MPFVRPMVAAFGLVCQRIDSENKAQGLEIGRWHGVEQTMGFYHHDIGDTYSARNSKISDISMRAYTDAAWAERCHRAAPVRSCCTPVRET